MKKILIPALVALLVVPVTLAPAVAEKESKSTTPVVAAVPTEYYRQMEAEKASRDAHRAAVDKRAVEKAKALKVAKAKKVAAAKKRAELLAKKREEARLAHIAWHKAQDKKAAALKKKAEAQTKKSIPTPQKSQKATNKAYTGGGIKAYAQSLVGADQFGCLDRLWMKESGWNTYADNPTSDAYGIPQALPGSKMASAGADWATNPLTQIRWGVGYIEGRYGSPCAAWAHSQSVGWY